MKKELPKIKELKQALVPQSEFSLQCECIKWFRYQYPLYKNLLFHIPNGGSRHKLEAINLKRGGVIPGIPDLMLAVPRISGWDFYHGLFIEMKSAKGKLTSLQQERVKELKEEGYMVEIINNFNSFKLVIDNYLK
jgi:hypothetical protein